MTNKPAFTLIELLIVISLIASLGFVFLFSFSSIRAKQALIASADELKSNIQRVHIYAREGKDNKSWGIKYINDNSYSLLSGSKKNTTVITNYVLQTPTEFKNGNFEIWFDLGTGETNAPKKIILVSPKNQSIELDINKNGLITSSGI